MCDTFDAQFAARAGLVVEKKHSDFFAREEKRSVISRADVDNTLNARIRRAARLRDRTQEAILELNRQLAEAEQKQLREVASVKAREEAEAKNP